MAGAPLEIVETHARTLQTRFALAHVRIWLFEPPRADGMPVLAAVADAQPNLAYGGLRETEVLAMLRRGALEPQVLMRVPADDTRFAFPLPAGTFVGLPLQTSTRRYGYVECYGESAFAFTTVGEIERAVGELLDVLDSARATHDAESPARGRILIADDDGGIRSLVRTLLTKQGFAIVDVENGRLALERARAQAFDLVLIDWMMPEMDGRETIVQLKRDVTTRDVPVVMLTSQSRIDDKVAALEAGAQDFITKPFNSRELIARIEQQLRWRRLLADEPDSRSPVLEIAAGAPAPAPAPTPAPTTAPAPAVTQTATLPASAVTGDLWSAAVEAQALGKHREALELFLAEAENSEEHKQFARAGIAYRSASAAAAQQQNADLANKLMRLSGKMYLCLAESATDTRSVQEGFISAARCFLAAGNLKLAQKSVGLAASFDAVLADDRPSSL